VFDIAAFLPAIINQFLRKHCSKSVLHHCGLTVFPQFLSAAIHFCSATPVRLCSVAAPNFIAVFSDVLFFRQMWLLFDLVGG